MESRDDAENGAKHTVVLDYHQKEKPIVLVAPCGRENPILISNVEYVEKKAFSSVQGGQRRHDGMIVS